MIIRTNFRIWLIVLISTLTACCATTQAKIIYVDAYPIFFGGDGTSWPTAFKYLQDALDDAVSSDEIWVAAGTYYPTELIDPCDPRTATFQMINGVAIYGGFPDMGIPDFIDRDPNQYETILSGDLLGNDNPASLVEDLLNDPCRTDNCYHVFYHQDGLSLDPNAVLDGFTITAGNADHMFWPHYAGGGMFNEYCSPTVSFCTFNYNSSLLGGGMYNWNSSNSKVSNCIFTSNSANDFGGGMSNDKSSNTNVINCIFRKNSASVMFGGGMSNWKSSPMVINCTFDGNSAASGGGIANWESSSPTASNCTFISNSATSAGGGMYNSENSAPTVTNCTFKVNSVYVHGGGMYNISSRPKVTNCTFTGNSADFGGGVHNHHKNSLKVTNCTFTENLAPNGNALACDSYQQSGPSNLHISNSILWDEGDEICNNDGSTITITYSDIDGGWEGEGNIDADPCFVDPGYWDPNDTPEDPNDDFWVDGDYHLKPSSPCIDAGDPCYVTGPDDVDKDGNPRVVDGDGDGIARIDMGPYEFQKKYCDGAGTPEDPYLICAPLHMHQIGVNHDDWDRHFKLTADIDLSAYTDTQFNIIGWYEGGLNNEPFTGVFDGNGHTISNFTYTSAGASYVGLFGYVAGETAAIRNLGLIDPNITCADGISIGTLAGCIAEGTVSNCYVKGGTVTGNEMVGGLTGRTGEAAVSRCFTTCDVMGNDWGIGGLIGDARQTTISACYATGSVTADNWGVGGLIGYQYAGQILTSYATGPVRGTDNGVGGLVGNAEGVYIEHCYAAGSVSGFDEVGGFAGRYSDGDILASFWDTLATGQVDGIGYEDQNGTVELFGRNTAQMRQQANFTGYGWDFVGESANGTEDVWTIWERAYYPRLTWENSITGDFTIDSNWMYQNLPGATNSAITTTVSVTNDPLANNSYTYRWEFALPEDVATAPTTTGSCGPDDPCCTFAALGCDQPAGLSDSGQPLTIQVTVIGDDYGNTGHAQAEFGIALLGDVNNDCVVNIADRAIINAFWRLGAAGPYTFTDCNINCDSSVNVADRAIANGIWRGALGQNSVSQPCPLR